MNDILTKECLDKEVCSLSNFSQYFKPNQHQSDTTYRKCTDDKAILYTQVFCLQSEKELERKTKLGYGLSIAVIIQATLFTIAI